MTEIVRRIISRNIETRVDPDSVTDLSNCPNRGTLVRMVEHDNTLSHDTFLVTGFRGSGRSDFFIIEEVFTRKLKKRFGRLFIESDSPKNVNSPEQSVVVTGRIDHTDPKNEGFFKPLKNGF